MAETTNHHAMKRASVQAQLETPSSSTHVSPDSLRQFSPHNDAPASTARRRPFTLPGLDQLLGTDLLADEDFTAFTVRYHRWLLRVVSLSGAAILLIGFVAGSAVEMSTARFMWMVPCALALLLVGAVVTAFDTSTPPALVLFFLAFGGVNMLGTPMSISVLQDANSAWMYGLMIPHVVMPFIFRAPMRFLVTIYLVATFVVAVILESGPPPRAFMGQIAAAFGLSAASAVIMGEIVSRIAMANWSHAREHLMLAASLEEEVRHRTQALRDLSVRLMAVRDDERKKLARDLHDQMSQDLTGVRHFLFLARQKQDTSLIARADGLVEAVHQSIRDTVTFLGGPTNDGDLKARILELAERFESTSGIVVTTDIDITLDDERTTAAAAIVREALTNTQRHANGATDVRITARDATLTVESDGAPLRDDWANGVGLGVLGMRARAEQVGATLTLAPGPRGGARVTLLFEDSSVKTSVDRIDDDLEKGS